MCGIAGYMHADPQRPMDPETLVAMAAMLHHRGPDGFGYHTVSGRGVGFSHARLAIIDLDQVRGRQPFVSPDGELMMTHNGEFYDYKRIRADLTSRGARFGTKSDSELALHLYRTFGLEGMLEQLRGEFAFGLYDRARDRLMLVRDRFGVKPLYWCEAGGTCTFGSELKALFANPEVPRRIEAEGLYHQLMQTIVPGTTAFDTVHQVQPGHVLIVERAQGRFRITDHRYWDMDFPAREAHDAPKSERHYVEGVREQLIDAVQYRLEADVPVACYLSGGIDSCAILGLAAAYQQAPVKAFTIGFDDVDYDETAIAREMAASVGADQDILTLDAAHLYDNFVKTLWHTERTIYNTLGVAKLLMSRHVNQAGYRVVVTGEGSDELFAGYPAFRRDMFLHGLDALNKDERDAWGETLSENNALVTGAMLAADVLHDAALDELVGFTPSCLQPWLAAARHAPGLMHPALRQRVKGYEPGRAIAETLDADMLAGRHPLDKAQYVWIKTMLEGQILTWGGDRVDMANSMEARPAFLDHHLAEFAASVPPSLRIKGNTEKYVLREAMRGLLPKVLYEREKFAFMAPPAHTDPNKWAAVEALASDYLSDSAIDDAGLLDAGGVRRVFAMHEDPDTAAATNVQLDAVINHLLGVQILHRSFVAQDIPRLARRRAAELGWAS